MSEKKIIQKDKISEVLLLSPLHEAEVIHHSEVVKLRDTEKVKSQVQMDIDSTRQNMKEVIEIGNKAVTNLADLAEQAQSDKMYTALANLINSLANISKEFINLNKTKYEIQKDELAIKEEDRKQQVNNNLFVGSTQQLQELMKSIKDK